MSLLKKASIITTPTAYAEDYLYSVKPAYALGSELVTNGTFDTDSDWTKGIGWTISGGKANRSGATINDYVGQDFNVIAGRNYIVKYDRTYVSGDGQTNLFAYFEGNSSRTTRGNYEDTTQETVTVTDYFTPTYTGNLALRFYGISDFTGSIDNLSVKEITDADFDFDRNSTGTRVNEDYLIEDVPYNIVKYSEDYTVSSWVKINANITANAITAPDGTLTADFLVPNTSNAVHEIRQDNPYGSTYHISFYAKQGGYKNLLVWDDYTSVGIGYNLDDNSIFRNQSANNYYIQDRNDGWKFIQLSLSTTNALQSLAFYVYDNSATPQITFSGDGTSGIYLWGVQVVKGDQPKDYLKTTDRLDIPRIDYTNGEPSILLEPSRTNTIGYSEDFSQSSWGKTNLTLASNNIVSPDGTLNASKLTVTSTGALLEFSQTLSVGSTFTVSAFVKEGTNKFVRLAYSSSSQTGAWFNLENKTVGTVNSTSASIEDYGNGWYRIISTFNSQIASGGLFLGLSNTDGATGDSVTGHTVYVWGFQVEAGSYATSLIHTSGSAVTRSADVANNAGNSDLFNDSEGVVYAEIKALADDQTARYYAISDGSSSNRIRLGFQSGISNRFRALVVSGSSITVDMNDADTTLSDITEYNKVAFKFKQNDFALYFNGREVKTDTNGNTPTGLNTLAFNNAGSTPGSFFYNNVKMVAVFKEALSDEELACLTGYNNHELYMNYYNRLSYLGLVEEYNVESDINNYIL